MLARVQVIFTQDASVSKLIEREMSGAHRSIDAALYRFSLVRLARALRQAHRRGIAVRLVLNARQKDRESRAIAALLMSYDVPFLTVSGRFGVGTKMHHKFAVVDERIVLTGSYNWTIESEEQNYDNLVILRDARVARVYRREFEALWQLAAPHKKGSP